MDQLRLLLLFGGESSEHDVSLTSAKNVYGALDKTKYEVSLGYISRDGKEWQLVESFDNLDGQPLVPILGQKAFAAGGDALPVDVIFPVLHGAHGEDGDVQGLARLMHIPCVGPSLIGAAMTMDKDVTKRLLRDESIPVVPWLVWHIATPMPSYEEVIATLGDVVFVKPANAGSSVGVSKVKSVEQYEKAMHAASEHDALVMVECAVDAREIEIAVLGNTSELQVSTPGEIIPGEEFYSYDDKYSDSSGSQAQIPADLPRETREQIKKYAAAAYMATRGQGMARIDFFVDKASGEVYLNEINSIPGFTNISMYPKMMEHDGLAQTALVDRLIQLALEV